MEDRLYLAVFVDGEYRTIKIVKADSYESAETKLKGSGWLNPVRLEELLFESDITSNYFQFN